ncbi:hypothetical protein ACFQZQ_09335 [Lysobacter koreensis]|uniref:DUF4388 domain-containing protein n=1 Tax=Lysobacter koreensis TaxID=266122 RepID=A0ABW2YPA7_9GAMM
MPLTLGFTGMDPVTESALQAAFTTANAQVGGQWHLLPEQQAAYVIVDMDSMYGPMSWLRLHANGKRVIGLTSAARTQTDFRLARPFDSASVTALLQQLDGTAPSAAANVAAPAAPASPAESVHPAGMTPAPQPQDRLPEEQPLPVREEIAPPPEPLSAVATELPARAAASASREPPSAAAAQVLPAAPSIAPRAPVEHKAAPAAPATAPTPAVVEAHAPALDTLVDWLASGKLSGRLRFERNGTALLIDTEQRQYHGPATLKALTGLFDGAVTAADFPAIDAATWSSQAAALGEPQSLARLVWYGALLAGHGTLAAGFDPEGRYQLLKWPQTEREFPKHFRIATAMMKGPATLAEIAEASGVPTGDVADFVNANLATGFADIYREPEPEVEPPKPSGLFGRLRGR